MDVMHYFILAVRWYATKFPVKSCAPTIIAHSIPTISERVPDDQIPNASITHIFYCLSVNLANQSHLSSVSCFSFALYFHFSIRSGCTSSWQALHKLTSCRSCVSGSYRLSARSGLSLMCLTWWTTTARLCLPLALHLWQS